MTVRELAESFRQQCETLGLRTESGRAEGPFGWSFFVKWSPTDRRRVVVSMKKTGESSFQVLPGRFDRVLFQSLRQAFERAGSAGGSGGVDEECARYFGQLDLLLSKWVEFQHAQPALDWTPLRDALRVLLAQHGVPLPEQPDAAIDASDPHAWRIAFEELCAMVATTRAGGNEAI